MKKLKTNITIIYTMNKSTDIVIVGPKVGSNLSEAPSLGIKTL